MGLASSYAPCGCSSTRLMEPEEYVFISWIRCVQHYVPEIDDVKILEAAKNRRKYEKEMWDEVNKFWNRGA